MPLLAGPRQVWTFDDLQRLLPEDAESDVDWRRFEILDGALVMSPSPVSWHEVAAARLLRLIAPAVPRGLELVGAIGVELDDSYLVPDLVVARAEVLAAGVPRLRPSEVSLVVEIVSPGSRTMDRVTKPARYAAAGIPAYWRVETDPRVTLTAYALAPDAGIYTELGTWGPGQVAEVDTPFAVRIPIDALVPSP